MNIREIASKARVSHSTVSRVVNHIPTVDPKLVRRVLAVIEEVGYRPNYQARALAKGRTHTVGLVVSELSGGNPFFSEVILYFERAAVAHGYEVLISFADIETDPNDVVVCVNRMRERQVEGIAVLTFGMEYSLANGNVSLNVPMVYVGPKIPLNGVRNIRVNYFPGMRDAVNHLVDFGHQRIGYLSGKLIWSSMQMRYEAFRRAANAVGLKFSKEIVAECDHTLEGGFQGMSQLLSVPKPPTAILCCNDMAAIGAMKILNMRGFQPGKDISLIGFDDLPLCKFMQPALTTIRLSPSDLAELAFRALLDCIQQNVHKSEYEYEARLVLRESTGAPRR